MKVKASLRCDQLVVGGHGYGEDRVCVTRVDLGDLGHGWHRHLADLCSCDEVEALIAWFYKDSARA